MDGRTASSSLSEVISSFILPFSHLRRAFSCLSWVFSLERKVSSWCWRLGAADLLVGGCLPSGELIIEGDLPLHCTGLGG